VLPGAPIQLIVRHATNASPLVLGAPSHLPPNHHPTCWAPPRPPAQGTSQYTHHDHTAPVRVSAALVPSMWVPPSMVLMLFTNPMVVSLQEAEGQ